MPRIVLACGDPAFHQALCKLLLTDGNFELLVESKVCAPRLMSIMEYQPDLVILGLELPAIDDDFQVVAEFKLIAPKAPAFLLVPIGGFESERDALHRGIDAVFSERDELESLMINARAVCRLESSARTH